MTATIPIGGLAAALKSSVADDVLQLAGGYHGPLSLWGVGPSTGIVTIRPADPASLPIFGQTKAGKSRGLAFTGGITWQGFNPSKNLDEANALLDIGSDCSDIIVDQCKLRTDGDVSHWTADDWVRKPFHLLLRARGTRITITRNDLSKCRDAMNIAGGTDILVDQCYIHQFDNDGIQCGGTRQRITRNNITASTHTPAEPLHPDGIQFFPIFINGVPIASRDIWIEGNTIDMSGVVSNGILTSVGQGITGFDGEMGGLTIRNNHVTVNGYNGIAIYGPDGCLIEKNTLIQAAGSILVPWIQIGKAKNGRAPAGACSITGNIAPKILAELGVICAGNKNAAGRAL
jgi:parallel beta-helix repeat protein